MYLFTSESVSEGHPDKIADQISDALLDEFLRRDPESKVACETFVTTGQVVVGGEVRTTAWVDIQKHIRRVINRIGYTKAEYMFDGNSCGILSAIHEQSPDINRGVVTANPDNQGAGDQGMMFGYACTETPELMPLPLAIAHICLIELAKIRREGKLMTYLRPDAKSQITIQYDDDNKPLRVHTIVLSTQHDEFDADEVMAAKIKRDVAEILLPRVVARMDSDRKKLFDTAFILHVNPTGKFVIGGPHGDTGLTGRKIIVDTYGGRGAHGGGAFSGKDPSKVDRSAAYAARYIAKNLVAAGIANEVLVQLAYAIGIAQPVSISVNTYGSSRVALSDTEIAVRIPKIFDLRPAKIIEKFQLKYPIYEATAAYGHFGRDPYTKEVEVMVNGQPIKKELTFFAWEKLDSVDEVKRVMR
ncbi:MAG: methionine adenosyltransferase [Bacteroidales bacterium]|nr:methionine adenosyltransferase [Bacteroidales bacterium]MCL2738125.1 methionine adenosyltransferase [Bacteroidales bacterium]